MKTLADIAKLPRNKKRFTPEEAAAIRDLLAKHYKAGTSVRDLAEASGRSYGFVHRTLTTTEGVTMRARGGAGRAKVPA